MKQLEASVKIRIYCYLPIAHRFHLIAKLSHNERMLAVACSQVIFHSRNSKSIKHEVLRLTYRPNDKLIWQKSHNSRPDNLSQIQMTLAAQMFSMSHRLHININQISIEPTLSNLILQLYRLQNIVPQKNLKSKEIQNQEQVFQSLQIWETCEESNSLNFDSLSLNKKMNLQNSNGKCSQSLQEIFQNLKLYLSLKIDHPQNISAKILSKLLQLKISKLELLNFQMNSIQLFTIAFIQPKQHLILNGSSLEGIRVAYHLNEEKCHQTLEQLKFREIYDSDSINQTIKLYLGKNVEASSQIFKIPLTKQEMNLKRCSKLTLTNTSFQNFQFFHNVTGFDKIDTIKFENKGHHNHSEIFKVYQTNPLAHFNNLRKFKIDCLQLYEMDNFEFFMKSLYSLFNQSNQSRYQDRERNMFASILNQLKEQSHNSSEVNELYLRMLPVSTLTDNFFLNFKTDQHLILSSEFIFLERNILEDFERLVQIIKRFGQFVRVKQIVIYLRNLIEEIESKEEQKGFEQTVRGCFAKYQQESQKEKIQEDKIKQEEETSFIDGEIQIDTSTAPKREIVQKLSLQKQQIQVAGKNLQVRHVNNQAAIKMIDQIIEGQLGITFKNPKLEFSQWKSLDYLAQAKKFQRQTFKKQINHYKFDIFKSRLASQIQNINPLLLNFKIVFVELLDKPLF